MNKNLSRLVLGFAALLLIFPYSITAQERVSSADRGVLASASVFGLKRSGQDVVPASPALSQLNYRVAGKSAPVGEPFKVSPQPKAATDGAVTIYGSVIYADTWTSDNAPYGIYSFPAVSNTALSPVHLGNNFEVNGGGAYVDGVYCFFNYFQYNGQIYVNYYRYDAATWELIGAVSSLPQSAMASDMDYDPVTKRIYGSFQREDLSGFRLASMDPETVELTPIADLPQMMYVMAVNSKGELYGVGADGNLYQINKETGALSLIGSTGLMPTYVQSGTFDHKSDRLYWCASFANTASGLYEISTKTGRASFISAIPDNAEVTAMYIPQPLAEAGAPAAVSGLALGFTEGNTTGTVDFTMPVKTFGGTSLSGTLDYTVLFNDEVVAEGTAACGEKVSKSITVSPGMYTVEVYASNPAGAGVKTQIKQWIGKDVPVAVTNLRLKKSGSKSLTLTWNAPASGLYGGYYDASAVTYKVVRYPDEAVVSENLTGTTLTDQIESDRLVSYWYEVTGCVGGLEGETAASNKVTIGTACAVPYFEDFLTAEDFGLYTVVNSNVDNYTWEWDEEWHSAKCKSDTEEKMNDWLISPPVSMGIEHVYKLTFKARCVTPVFPETLKVCLGSGRTSSSMTTVLVPETVISSSENETLEAIIKLDKAGDYRVGFQSLSHDKFNLYVDSIQIVQGASRNAPDAASDLKVEVAAQGELKATVSFITPSLTINGAATSLTKVELYRDGTLIHTFDNPAVNTCLSYTDLSAKQGYNRYMVVASNAEGQGLEATSKVYVGVDIPGLPVKVKVKDVNGSNVLTWEAPLTGETGGYIDPETLTYTVQRVTDREIVARDIKALTFTETLEVVGGGQIHMAYNVWAKSAAGEGKPQESNAIMVGEPYELKFEESFTGAGVDRGPWGLLNSGTASYWNTSELGSFLVAAPQDNDGGLASFTNGATGDESVLYSAKITLKNTVRPMLDFYYYATPGSTNRLIVEISKEGGAFEAVETLDFAADNHAQGWQKLSVPLVEFNTAEYVQLGFHAVAGNNAYNIHIDNIVVRDLLDHNLQVSNLSVPKRLHFGEKNEITATVYNDGAKAATGYTVELYRDGVKVAEQAGTALEAGRETTVSFMEVPTREYAETVVYYASVSYPADMKPADNRSEEVAASVVMPKYPAVNDLKAACDDGKSVVLSWSEPDLSEVKSGVVTEGFEDYQAFIVDHIGNWKVEDVDGSLTYGISNNAGGILNYDNAGKPMAFQVFNPSLLGLENTEWATYAGEQMIVSFSDEDKQSDDWLISPELTGEEQMITFYARSVSPMYQETFEVLVSMTGTDLSCFIPVLEETIAPNVWTSFTADLPEGAKYFAIRATSRDCYALLIDEITYGSKAEAMTDLTLEGYNIYRNNVKVNAVPVQENGYQDIVAEGDYTYRVTAVYNAGESIYSNEAKVQVTSSIGETLADASQVSVADGVITVRNAAGKSVSVYASDGRLLYSGMSAGNVTVAVPAGHYLVRIACNTVKVLVE